MDRVRALVDAKVDVVVIDSAHGHSANIFKTLKMIKSEFPDLQELQETLQQVLLQEILLKQELMQLRLVLDLVQFVQLV